MKILLDVTRRKLKEAKFWVIPNEETLIEIEEKLRKEEALWGECFMFFETYFYPPRIKGERFSRQFDFLICFDDRVAICEVKNRRWKTVRDTNNNLEDIEKIVKQIEGQIKTIKHYFHFLEEPKNRVAPLLLMPITLQKAIDAVAKRLDIMEVSYIGVGGFHEQLSRRYKFLQVLCNWLGKFVNDSSMNSQQKIERFLINQERTFMYFQNVKTLIQKLVSMRPEYEFDQPAYYLKELRKNEIKNVTQQLHSHKVLEINGVNGIGKSSFINELIEETMYDHIAYNGYTHEHIVLRKCHDMDSICESIFSHITGRVPTESTNILLRDLSLNFLIYWIEFKEETPLDALQEFIKALAKLQDDDKRALWIFESSHPIFSSSPYPHFFYTLEGLSSNSIYSVLQQVEAGGGFHDIAKVIDLAHGNPGIAIKLWQAQQIDSIEHLTHRYKWYSGLFSGDEQRLLKLLCFLFKEWALGLSFQTLLEIAYSDKVFDLQRVQKVKARETLTKFLEKLENYRLIKIDRANQEAIENAFEEQLDIEDDLIIISWVDEGLLAHIVDRLGDLQDYFQNLVEQYTNLHTEDMLDTPVLRSNLTNITRRLIEFHDVWFFLRSTFRNTHRGEFINWIQKQLYEELDEEQKYIFKALKVMQDLAADPHLGGVGPRCDVLLSSAYPLQDRTNSMSTTLKASWMSCQTRRAHGL